MAQTTIELRTVHGTSAAVAWSNGRTVVIDRPPQAGGLGIGFNGGELMLLAIGGCFCNDLFREAQLRSIVIDSVRIEVSCDWGGDPVRARDVSFSVTVEGAASEEQIQELIRHTDQVAEIPNSLRYGTGVRLISANAISSVPSSR